MKQILLHITPLLFLLFFSTGCTHAQNRNYSIGLKGTLSIGYDSRHSVYFHLDNKRGEITGQYCYGSWIDDNGFDVTLKGEMKNDSIFLMGTDENGYEKVSIIGKVSNMTKHIKKIEGIWENLNSREILDLYIQETGYDWEYPFLPTQLEGYYKNSDQCEFDLNIHKQADKYMYEIQTGGQNFKGEISFYRRIGTDRHSGRKENIDIIFKDIRVSDRIYRNEFRGVIEDNEIIFYNIPSFFECKKIHLKKNENN